MCVAAAFAVLTCCCCCCCRHFSLLLPLLLLCVLILRLFLLLLLFAGLAAWLCCMIVFSGLHCTFLSVLGFFSILMGFVRALFVLLTALKAVTLAGWICLADAALFLLTPHVKPELCFLIQHLDIVPKQFIASQVCTTAIASSQPLQIWSPLCQDLSDRFHWSKF